MAMKRTTSRAQSSSARKKKGGARKASAKRTGTKRAAGSAGASGGRTAAKRGAGAAKKGATKKKASKRRYGQKSQEKVGEVMHELKRGQLKSGRSGKKVTSRKQAIAIGLSEARRAGGKVPPQKRGKKS